MDELLSLMSGIVLTEASARSGDASRFVDRQFVGQMICAMQQETGQFDLKNVHSRP